VGGPERPERDAGSFRDLVDELPVLVWVASPEGRVEWRNAFAEGFSGLSIEAVLGDQFAVLHPDERAAVVAFLERAIGAGESFETEFRSLRSDGEYRWVILRARPVRDGQGANPPVGCRRHGHSRAQARIDGARDDVFRGAGGPCVR